MKQKNKIWIYPLLVMGFLLMFITSCEKDENLADYASEIIGTYNGTVTVVGTGTVAGTSIITKSSEQVVDLEILISSVSVPLNGIKVSSSGADTYDLNITDASGSFNGKVEGSSLTWTLSASGITETFSGTK